MSDATASKSRVLVVDDSRLIQKAVLKMLGGEFDVVAADDGVEAWTIIENDASIDVVFVDLDMPRMDGFELIRTVRGASAAGISNLPLIVVTGVKEDEAARMQALEAGATDFITKPFTTSDLLARARAHARHQRITLQLQAQTTLDALSGLLNKAGFTDRLQQDISYARRHQQALTLARLEIDDMRGLFLAHGKDTAERVVLHVAQLLRANIRMEDSAGRMGLGGFALSVPGGEQAGVERMLARVCAEVAEHAPSVGGERLPLTLHAAVMSDLGPNAQEALDHCQARLDAARSGGARPAAATPAPPPVANVETPAATPVSSEPVAPSVVTAPLVPGIASSPAAVAARPIAPSAAAPAAMVQPAESATPPPLMAPPAAGTAPPGLDALLGAIERGQTQAAAEQMPQILHRLQPLLRLLTPVQRNQLARFLLQLR